MCVFNKKLVLVLLVTVTLVHGYRRGGDRKGYNHVSKPMSSREQLMYLKGQLYSCTGMFLCGIRTDDNKCNLECIDEDRICNGATECFNGRDETNCPSQTCPPCPVETPGPEETPCPDMTPCPEQTPCPSNECPTGQIRCGDGSECKEVTDICDGSDSCPDGDFVDDTVLNCNPDRCVVLNLPDACAASKIPNTQIVTAKGVMLSECRDLCNAISTCIIYMFQSLGDCLLFSSKPEIETGPCETLPDAFELYFCNL